MNQKKKTRAAEYSVEETSELLPFLLKTLNKSSRNSVKSILTRGQVTVDGKMLKQHDHLLVPGQVVAIQNNKASIKETALDGVQILYEDEDLLVIAKDAGVLSVAAKNGQESTVYRQLMHYVKQDHPKNRIYIVHRLDRDTSGVMLFAKSENMKQLLQENWKEAVVERMYTALVEGDVQKETGTVASWLTESKAYKVHSSPFDNGGKKAVTHYKKIRSNRDFCLLEILLETGRKNQIRVHMEEIGHPIAGDKKYGARTNPLKRLGLHATTLIFIHPKTGERMQFHSKIPQKFLKAVKE